jgi:hypothetical protein
MIRNRFAYDRAVLRNEYVRAEYDLTGCYNYWKRAERFEKESIARKDWKMAAFQKAIRVEYENHSMELHAMEGGNI